MEEKREIDSTKESKESKETKRNLKSDHGDTPKKSDFEPAKERSGKTSKKKSDSAKRENRPRRNSSKSKNTPMKKTETQTPLDIKENNGNQASENVEQQSLTNAKIDIETTEKKTPDAVDQVMNNFFNRLVSIEKAQQEFVKNTQITMETMNQNVEELKSNIERSDERNKHILAGITTLSVEKNKDVKIANQSLITMKKVTDRLDSIDMKIDEALKPKLNLDLEKELKQIQQEYEDLEKENDILRQRIDLVLSKYNQLHENNKKLVSQINDLESNQNQLRIQNKSLEQTSQETIKKAVERAFYSMAMELSGNLINLEWGIAFVKANQDEPNEIIDNALVPAQELIQKITSELKRQGIKRIGALNEKVTYDPDEHNSYSDTLRPGDTAFIQQPGWKQEEFVLQKPIVVSEEEMEGEFKL